MARKVVIAAIEEFLIRQITDRRHEKGRPIFIEAETIRLIDTPAAYRSERIFCYKNNSDFIIIMLEKKKESGL